MTKEELAQIEDNANRIIDMPYELRNNDTYQYAYFLGNDAAPKAVYIASNDAHTVHQLHIAKKTILKLVEALKERIV